MADDRNPLFIPTQEPKARGCPKCSKMSWVGRNIGGSYTFTCRDCGFQWQGGLPRVPQDPRVPVPPTNPKDKPSIEFERTNKADFNEVRNRPSLVPDFRKGAPIKGDDDGG